MIEHKATQGRWPEMDKTTSKYLSCVYRQYGTYQYQCSSRNSKITSTQTEATLNRAFSYASSRIKTFLSDKHHGSFESIANCLRESKGFCRIRRQNYLVSDGLLITIRSQNLIISPTEPRGGCRKFLTSSSVTWETQPRNHSVEYSVLDTAKGKNCC